MPNIWKLSVAICAFSHLHHCFKKSHILSLWLSFIDLADPFHCQSRGTALWGHSKTHLAGVKAQTEFFYRHLNSSPEPKSTIPKSQPGIPLILLHDSVPWCSNWETLRIRILKSGKKWTLQVYVPIVTGKLLADANSKRRMQKKFKQMAQHAAFHPNLPPINPQRFPENPSCSLAVATEPTPQNYAHSRTLTLSNCLHLHSICWE